MLASFHQQFLRNSKFYEQQRTASTDSTHPFFRCRDTEGSINRGSPKMNRLLLYGNPIKMDDLSVPRFQETSINTEYS